MNYETLGWIGSLLLAGCAIPEVYSAFRNKTCGLTWGFLGLWYAGEWFIAVPVFLDIQEPFLMANYGINIVLITYLIVVKWRQNEQQTKNYRDSLREEKSK